jgi:hypothetical protein
VRRMPFFRASERLLKWAVALIYTLLLLALLLSMVVQDEDHGKLAVIVALAVVVEMGWRLCIWLRQKLERL